MNVETNFEKMIETQSPAGSSAARKRFSSVGMACFVIFIVSSALQFAAAALTGAFAPQLYEASWFKWVMTFAPIYFVAVPIGLLMLKRIPKEQPEQRKMSAGQLAVYLLMCICIMYAGSLLGNMVMTIVQMNAGISVPNIMEAYAFGDGMALKIICIVFLSPIIEELVFRRQIIDRLHKYGEGVAIFVSALLFGLFHGNLYQFFYAFGLGLMFAYVYVRTGRLRYSVILHMIINLLGSVIAPWLVQGLDLNSMGSNVLESLFAPQFLLYIMYVLAYFACAIAGFVLLIVKRKSFFLKQTNERLPKTRRFKTVFLNPGMILVLIACLAAFALPFVSF